VSRTVTYRNRQAAAIENADLRVTVTVEGGHIAEIFDKHAGVNPLWTPPWPSIEPSAYDPARHPEYGEGAEAKLLSGIMGHNICLDVFGGPSPEEAAAGMTVHGEGPLVPYTIEAGDGRLRMQAVLPRAGLRFERDLALTGRAVRITERVSNDAATDRPIAWTEHATLGPPFIDKGRTVIRASATRSKVLGGPAGLDDYLMPGAEFDWPMAPRRDGGMADLRLCTDAPATSGYTAHLMDQTRADAFVVAFSPAHQLAFGYVWRPTDFPWFGIWEENFSRQWAPWLGRSLTRGLEFGVSPMPETRRAMIDRGQLFGVPTYRWIPARSTVTVEYWAVCQSASAPPSTLAAPA
jgi:hypothetical protein